MPNKNIIILTITGPSLSGKSTLEQALADRDLVAKATSVTTRPMRHGEKDGEAYHFIDTAEMDRLKENNLLVEHIFFDKNQYGVSKEEVLSKTKHSGVVSIVAAPEGVQQIKEYAEKEGWTCLRAFVYNPDEVLKARFDQRFANDKLANPEVYQNRWNSMKTVEKEWREQMKDAELQFNRFDDTTQEEVIRTIAQAIYKKNTATPAKRRGPK